MTTFHDNLLKEGFTTAYLDRTYPSNLAYKPQFISNNYKEGRKVLSSIEDELLACEEFFISVAFVTMGGITPLLQTLKELERRGIPGKILTTDYQNFSEPRALRKLAELSNITLKMYRTDEAQEGFHTKGYIFKNEELYRIIVGSSNLTLSAMTKNREWNTKVVSTDQGEYASDLMAEFTDLWNSEYAVAFEDFIEEYALNYRIIRKQRKIAKEAQVTSLEQYKLLAPRFWLGMTASPERTDAFDVYDAFDHNIAYEIRLQQALEENLLCPFHYFGITDLQIDGETVDEETGLKDFNKLTSDDRVSYVIEQMEYYGYCGKRPKGLVFCSSKKEAGVLSEKFNERGYRTLALTGDDSQEKREQAVERLVLEDGEDKLDYIFTVDIFNEGVDIPEVNQVIMLRPTESPIVFVQQLGRGLRKADDKEYVVILDFIGNYKNNFMIPIALSGDRSYNKDNIRRYVLEGERIIPGSSTIHFDEISRKRIFAAIDSANFSDIKLIKENYKNLKNKLGRIPALKDFDNYGEMDVLRIFDNNSLGSYYKFLVKYEKDYTVRLSAAEEKVIEFISRKLASGKRIHELALLNRMLSYHHGFFRLWEKDLTEDYGIKLQDKTIKNVVNVMTNEFPTGSGKNTYSDCVFMEKTDAGEYELTEEFSRKLRNPEFYKILKELVEFGVSRYEENYSRRYQDTNFVLYQKYTYEDVCRLLEWENNEVPLNLGGYKYDRKMKTFPVFINYDKEEDIQDTIKYEDHFESPNRLIAISKQSRTKDSEDVQNFLHARERGIDVELFVRKNKDDKISKEFYYLGRMTATGKAEEFIMANTDKTAVEIEWDLDTPVREDIYEYIVNN